MHRSRQLPHNTVKFTLDLLFLRPSIYPLHGPNDADSHMGRPKESKPPRVLIQQGRCGEGECNQFSISISNGERGMTVRFDSEAEFRNFLERGAAEKR